MDPHSDSDAPALDVGVLSRMRRLDPQLRVTWSKCEVDVLTGQMLITTNTRRPIFNPSWHLWRKDEASGRCFYVSSHRTFGQREVAKLEADVARYLSPSEIFRRMADGRAARELEGRRRQEERKRDVIGANESRIRDLVFEHKDSRRAGKIFSGGGITHRGSSGFVEMDSREAGWDLPVDQQGR